MLSNYAIFLLFEHDLSFHLFRISFANFSGFLCFLQKSLLWSHPPSTCSLSLLCYLPYPFYSLFLNLRSRFPSYIIFTHSISLEILSSNIHIVAPSCHSHLRLYVTSLDRLPLYHSLTWPSSRYTETYFIPWKLLILIWYFP